MLIERTINIIPNFNSSDWIIFGIEWNKEYLVTFINNKVLYHANPIRTRWGDIIKATTNPYYLPYEHAFNLLLHIGVRSFLPDMANLFELDEILLKSWVSPVFEIDYVKVYGKTIDGKFNESISSISLPQNNSTILYTSIGIITAVFIFLIIIIIVLVYFIRKKAQKNIQDNYDDIGQEETKYEDINYDYGYEVIQYSDVNINSNQGDPEYLILTDPLADLVHMNRNFKKKSSSL